MVQGVERSSFPVCSNEAHEILPAFSLALITSISLSGVYEKRKINPQLRLTENSNVKAANWESEEMRRDSEKYMNFACGMSYLCMSFQ